MLLCSYLWEQMPQSLMRPHFDHTVTHYEPFESYSALNAPLNLTLLYGKVVFICFARMCFVEIGHIF